MDELPEYNWPKAFPEDIPNLDEVIPAQGKVFRLVKKCPPDGNDFRMHKEDCPGYMYSKSNISRSYGVSFWAELSQAKQVKINYPSPEQFGDMAIVSGQLVNSLGVICREVEDDGHVTLWVQDGAEPHLHVNCEENDK
jgi:hypothetical protein